ncbi:MAG: ATP-binding protein [Candidatus Aminicenantaceae bacterium]
MAKENCTLCQDTGWILEEVEGRPLAKRCRCYVKRQNQILFDQANIPRRYQECTLDNFKPLNASHRDAVKIAKKLITNYPVQESGLLLQGPCGVGKTHLAVAIIRDLIWNKNVPCYFYDFRQLMRDLQNSYSSESPMTESEVLAPVFNKKVMVLDELGAKRTTPWVEETIFYIINHRYNNKQLTIFTTNYLDRQEDEEEQQREVWSRKKIYEQKQEESLENRIGVRLHSRVHEMCKIVNVEGKDFRKTALQASFR